MSHKARKKRGKHKQGKPSWQPTLNHYFGGKSIPVQPTLGHFVQKVSKDSDLVKPKNTAHHSSECARGSHNSTQAEAIIIDSDDCGTAQLKDQETSTRELSQENTLQNQFRENGIETSKPHQTGKTDVDSRSHPAPMEKKPSLHSHSPCRTSLGPLPVRNATTHLYCEEEAAHYVDDVRDSPDERVAPSKLSPITDEKSLAILASGGGNDENVDSAACPKKNRSVNNPFALKSKHTNVPCLDSAGQRKQGPKPISVDSSQPQIQGSKREEYPHFPSGLCKEESQAKPIPRQSSLGNSERRKKPFLSLKMRKRKLSNSPSKMEGGRSSKLRVARRGMSVAESAACLEFGGKREKLRVETLTTDLEFSSKREEGERMQSSFDERSVEVLPLPTVLSSGEEALLLQYANAGEPQRKPSLADLEDCEKNKNRNGGLAVSSPTRSPTKCYTYSSTAPLPLSPSFSPLKPKAFSPLLERMQVEEPILHTSLSLFSPPSHHNSPTVSTTCEDVVMTSPPKVGLLRAVDSNSTARDEKALSSTTKMTAKRALFQSHEKRNASKLSTPGSMLQHCPTNRDRGGTSDVGTKADTAQSAVTVEESNLTNDFSCVGEFDLSDFLSDSLLGPEVHDHTNAVKCESHDPTHDVTGQSQGFNRYLVLESVTQECVDEDAVLSSGRYKPEVVLRLFDEKTSTEKFCYLRDDWIHLAIAPGDTVQVNAPFIPHKGGYIIDRDREDSSVVVSPDCLISGTTIATSITCVRRAVLSEQLKGGGCNESEAMTIGKMLHEVFQQVLRRAKGEGWGPITMAMVAKEIQSVVGRLESLEQLYALDMLETDAVQRLSEQSGRIVEWCGHFLHPSPLTGKGEIEFKRSASIGDEKACIAVSNVLDIEENMWCPRLGLKGKIDVTVEIKEQRGGGRCVQSYRAPLELKTGKMFRKQGTVEHRAQVTLYSMMLADQARTNSAHDIDQIQNNPGGLLFYLKTGHMQGLPSLPHEKRGLLIARNHLARYLGNHTSHMTLPGMLRDKHTCKSCPYLKQCALYHRAMENGTVETSGLGDLFSPLTLHLSPSHLLFFAHWYRLVMVEQSYCRVKEGAERFWLRDPAEREKEGGCLANMVASVALRKDTGRYLQTFSQVKPTRSLATLTFSSNDRVAVSHQDGTKWAVAMGTITMATPTEVQVLLDRSVLADETVYRLDRMEGGHSSGLLLSNLMELCTSDSERDHRLRELIIDLDPPRFRGETSCSQEMEDVGKLKVVWSMLNSSQKAAISKVLTSRDYTLVLGMPGTGKTTTIACLVRVLVAQGKSVLLASYTHAAVDNILLKLQEAGLDFLRLGSALRVHPDITPHIPAIAAKKFTSVHQLKELYHSKLVVATTCLGVTHSLFTRRCFDYCIIDEASQLTLPASLGPLRHAGVFVLVGDHYQLPPLVQSEQAREGGYDVSLFRRLTEHHPNALVSLEEQYRMNKEIMSLSNGLVYNHRLKCGSEAVASARLTVPLWGVKGGEGEEGWLWRVVDPDQPVVFLNTDGCSAHETNTGDKLYNAPEAKIVMTITLALVKAGVNPSSIGVITPYRQQMTHIRELFSSEKGEGEGVRCVEVNTVDRYQGRDKDCVLLSCVRSNDKGNVGRLLLDWRRLNVALTRAKHKLILIGSHGTLNQTPLVTSLLQILNQNGWIVQLPSTVY